MAATPSSPSKDLRNQDWPADIVAKWFQGQKSLTPGAESNTQAKPVTPRCKTRIEREPNAVDVGRLQNMPDISALLRRSDSYCSPEELSEPANIREKTNSNCPFCQTKSMDWLADILGKIQASLDEQTPVVTRCIENTGMEMEAAIKREFYHQRQQLCEHFGHIDGALDVLVSKHMSDMSSATVQFSGDANHDLATMSQALRDQANANAKDSASTKVSFGRSYRADGDDDAILNTSPTRSPGTDSLKTMDSVTSGLRRGSARYERHIMRQHCKRMEKGEFNTKTDQFLRYCFAVRTNRLAEWHRTPKSRFVHVIDSVVFSNSVVCLILANAVWMGYETDQQVRNVLAHPSVPSDASWHHINNFFSVLFTLELLLRIVALKQAFWFRHDWLFNMYDLIVVITSWAEVLTVNTLAQLFRTMRVVRVIRVMRVLRMAHLFNGLRHIGIAIAACVEQIGWLLIIVLFIIFMFSIMLLQLVTAFLGRDDEKGKAALSKHFGTVGDAMFSLAKSVSGGMPWGDLADELQHVGWSLKLYLTAFVFLVSFGLITVVVGVFVDRTLELKTRDHNLAIHNERSLTRSFFAELRRLFEDEGLAHDACLDWDAFDSQLKKSDVQMYLQAQNIDVSDASELFRLLDLDGTGSISFNDFVHGCHRMRGPAKRLDIVSLHEQQQFLMSKQQETQDHQKSLEHNVTALVSVLHKELRELRVDVAAMDSKHKLMGAMPTVSRSKGMASRSNSLNLQRE